MFNELNDMEVDDDWFSGNGIKEDDEDLPNIVLYIKVDEDFPDNDLKEDYGFADMIDDIKEDNGDFPTIT